MLKMKKTITITHPYQNPRNTNFPTLPSAFSQNPPVNIFTAIFRWALLPKTRIFVTFVTKAPAGLARISTGMHLRSQLRFPHAGLARVLGSIFRREHFPGIDLPLQNDLPCTLQASFPMIKSFRSEAEETGKYATNPRVSAAGFLSYARHDRKIAEQIRRALQNNDYSVWFDSAVRPGRDWIGPPIFLQLLKMSWPGVVISGIPRPTRAPGGGSAFECRKGAKGAIRPDFSQTLPSPRADSWAGCRIMDAGSSLEFQSPLDFERSLIQSLNEVDSFHVHVFPARSAPPKFHKEDDNATGR